MVASIYRDLHAKYRNSLLGGIWALLNPLATIVIYTLIFSTVMRARLPGVDSSFAYSIYVCAGVLVWTLFFEILTRTVAMFPDNANLLKKVKFPRLCLPLIIVGTALVNFLIIFGLFFCFLMGIGAITSPLIVLIVPIIVLTIWFAASLGCLLAIANVFFRDVGQFVNTALQFVFWLTPIVYPATILPLTFQQAMAYHPLAVLINGTQSLALGNSALNWWGFVEVVVICGLLSIAALYLYNKHGEDIVDEL